MTFITDEPGVNPAVELRGRALPTAWEEVVVDPGISSPVIGMHYAFLAPLYALTESELYVSNDDGATWTALGVPVPNREKLTCLTGAGGYLWIGGERDLIMRWESASSQWTVQRARGVQPILDIAAADEIRTQTTVSLNKVARIAEREERQAERLKRENDRRVAAGLEPVASLEDLDVEDQPDILLNQATQIITDLVSLESARSAALTESNAPGS